MEDRTAREALDRARIMDLIAGYAYFYDEGELDRFMDLFWEDATLDITPDPGFFPLPLVGRAAIDAAYRGRYAEVSVEARRRHIQSNTLFLATSPTEIRAATFLVAMSVPRDEGGVRLLGTGVYRDRFTCRDGEWRFQERNLTMDTLAR